MLVLALLAGNPWVDPAPQGRWAASTSQLATEMLPPEMARDVVSHVVTRSIVQGGDPFSVEFLGRSKPTGDGFCQRFHYYVSVSEFLRQGGRVEPMRSEQIRLGDCPRGDDAIFANLNSSDVAQAKQALRWVAWAQKRSRSEGQLPLRLSCTTEIGADRCADGGRKALADLPLNKVYIVMPQSQAPAHQWKLVVTETEPGQLLWDVAIDATPGRSSIDLVWKAPAPF